MKFSQLRKQVIERQKRDVRNQILKIKLKIFITQNDKFEIQKLQQKYDELDIKLEKLNG